MADEELLDAVHGFLYGIGTGANDHTCRKHTIVSAKVWLCKISLKKTGDPFNPFALPLDSGEIAP
jgi:hypothetical protein